MNIDGFDISNKFELSDVFWIGKKSNLSINFIEIRFHREGKKVEHRPVPIENSKSDSGSVVDVLT